MHSATIRDPRLTTRAALDQLVLQACAALYMLDRQINLGQHQPSRVRRNNGMPARIPGMSAVLLSPRIQAVETIIDQCLSTLCERIDQARADRIDTTEHRDWLQVLTQARLKPANIAALLDPQGGDDFQGTNNGCNGIRPAIFQALSTAPSAHGDSQEAGLGVFERVAIAHSALVGTPLALSRTHLRSMRLAEREESSLFEAQSLLLARRIMVSQAYDKLTPEDLINGSAADQEHKALRERLLNEVASVRGDVLALQACGHEVSTHLGRLGQLGNDSYTSKPISLNFGFIMMANKPISAEKISELIQLLADRDHATDQNDLEDLSPYVDSRSLRLAA